MNTRIAVTGRCQPNSSVKKKHLTPVDLVNDSEVSSQVWSDLQTMVRNVLDSRLLPYMLELLPRSVIEQAAVDCFSSDNESTSTSLLKDESFLKHFFAPWCLFRWVPFETFGLKDFSPSLTISQNYLLRYSSSLKADEIAFIQSMNQTYYSFYRILRVEKNKKIYIEDMILDTVHTLKEQSATHELKKDQIIFASILDIQSQTILVSMAPTVLNSNDYGPIKDVKRWLVTEKNKCMPLTAQSLHEGLDMDLLDNFFGWKLRQTDSDLDF